MKSADDYYDELDSVDEFSLLRLIRKVQEDTIEETVIACVKYARIKSIVVGRMHSLNGSWNEYGSAIDKESILKVGQMLKSKL